MSEFVLELNDDNFQKEIVDSKLPVMVDFWASWCGPCKMMSSVIDEVAKDFKDRIRVAKVNVEDSQGIAADIGIMNIPTVVFFKNGKEASRFSGAVPKKELASRIEKILNA